jgi:hypothetical protein
LVLLVAVVVCGSTGCDKSEEQTRGAAPPPVASAKPGACAGGGAPVPDAVSSSFFPPSVGGYCVDAQVEVRTYGEQGKLDMEAVCTTAFDGECAVYNQFGLKRLVSLRYIDGAGTGSTADVYLSRFADAVGAYAMFTKRVVADGDPADPATPKPLEAGGAGALGTGRAYVWKDKYLVELQYNNEQETPEALASSSAKALSALGAAIGAKLAGSTALPPAVAALPEHSRIANGVQLLAKDALGIAGLGPLAVGFYLEPPLRYRLAALVAADDAKAMEAWKLLKGRPGALPVGGVGDEAVAVTLTPPAPNGGHRDYVFTRKGPVIVGVGDEEIVTDGPRLSKEDKVARLKSWLASRSAAPPKR